ncbi:MAG TPA: zinc dependent phospholipase C family protein [Bryobacteraceae bacterium]|nr:zinc dependent phospholipase C family protein [Bryobacteraceae bacterium]
MKRAVVCVVALLACRELRALSVLTHEAVIDSAWDQGIRPLLVKRFPQATHDDLRKARAYAYGGSIIQDMGYYPFGSKFFTDLAHYVRSGDFVVNLLADSQDLNEYAFALGSLAHYATDNEGHAIAINPSVGMEFPRLRRKFGPIVTYADDRTSHLRVEFSFDVQQVAHGNYAPQSYHDFIGFEVAKPVLERAFQDTYGLRIEDVFHSLDLALGMYRYSVSGIIPDMTRAAWKQHRDELMRADPKMTRRRFIYAVSRARYRKEWGEHEPPFGTRVLVAVLRMLPKVGPLKVASFKPPAPAATADFERSFVDAVNEYQRLLGESARPGFSLPDRDFDTGKLTAPAEYRLADEAYAQLAIKLAALDPARVNAKLRANVLEFYRDQDLPFATRKNRKEWQRTVTALEKLRTGAGQAAGLE